MKTYDFRTPPFKLFGVPNWDGSREMERVPASVVSQLECAEQMQSLARRCPGARLCFRTDSTYVEFHIKLENISPDIGMSIYCQSEQHMFVGERPTARYAVWSILPIIRPRCASATLKKAPIWRTVTLYLPRSRHVTSIEILLNDDAHVESAYAV